MHTKFSYLFAILSIFHLFTFNWKTFFTYIKAKARAGLNRKREFYLAFALTAMVLIGVVYTLPPFSSLMILGENLKESWEQEYESPPVPHAEEYTIARLSEEILYIPIDNVLSKLAEIGIEVENNDQTLKELAVQQTLTPQEIYSELASLSEVQTVRIPPGQGIGRKSLDQISAENNIPVDQLITLLRNEGIEARGEDVLRDLSDRHKMSPSELLSVLNSGELAP
jgi:hypothetical protein